MKMEPSNVRTKIGELLNVIKIQSDVMLVQPNVTIELSNMRGGKKNLPNVTN